MVAGNRRCREEVLLGEVLNEFAPLSASSPKSQTGSTSPSVEEQ